MRIIHNTSYIINNDLENKWVAFMQKHYISVLRANELCRDIIFTKVSIDQPDGKTYSLQLVFDTEEQLNCFLENRLPELEEKLICDYANQYVCFSSVLTEI